MSEYQFYEFQAIDRPLSPEDQKYVQSLSSRVKLTATNAQFLYNYGDFRGKPEELLDRCFDIHVYVANFGVRTLMIRFPKSLVDPKRFEPYCVKHCISTKTTTKSTILKISIVREDYYGWLEEETYAAGLLPLREALLKGDLRLLYLAWLATSFAEDAPNAAEEMVEPLRLLYLAWLATSFAEDAPNAAEEMVEPPVPSNFQQLSPDLQAFADLFQIDPDLIAAAAIESIAVQEVVEPITDWIATIPESERNAYLVRVAQGETHVGAELMQRLRQKFSKTSKAKLKSPGRTLAELITIADEQREIRENKATKATANARQKYLKTIAPKADAIWQEAMALIELKQAKPYDEAVAHLVDLRDLAASQGNLAEFQARIKSLQKRYTTRSGLLTRLQKAGLLT
jgi:hypothetical protein